MELIRKLGTKKNKNGRKISYGKFLCPFCLQLVERQLSNGKSAKSCGCILYILSSQSLKGRKLTEETKQKIRKKAIGRVGYWKGKKRPEETKQKIKDNHVNLIGKSSPLFGRKHTEETKEKMRINRKGKYFGEDNPNWNNGSSFEPYSPEFNKELKQQILKRDNYTCQCPDCEHKSVILQIHHIDYDKNNSNPENLITLCNSCHTKTNGKNNRNYWINYYQNIIINIL